MLLRTLSLSLICGAMFLAAPTPAQWQPAASPPGDLVDDLFPEGTELYCSSYLGKVYVTTDHAQSWTEVGTMTHGTAINAMIIHDDWLLISRQGWAGNHRIRRAAEGWTAWEPWPDQAREYLYLTAWGGRIYAVTDGGFVVSDDHGLAWSPVPAPDGRRAYQLFGARGALFAVTRAIGQSNGLLHRSVDGGATWQDVTGPMASIIVHVWAEHLGAIYIVKYLGGGQGEVYRSLDDGLTFALYTDMPSTGYGPSAFATAGSWLAVGYPSSQAPSCFLRDDDGAWQDYAQNIGFPQINVLAAQGGFLYKTGGSVGLLRAPLPFTSAIDNTPPAPVAQLRVQPNPFNPRTSVVFTAPGAARLAVYDARGLRLREVAVADAGQWTWDGTDDSGRAVPSGTYLLRLESAQGVLARQAATLLR
jgi:hypothetical protein